MSNYQRVDIDQPAAPRGYSFKDSDEEEYSVDCAVDDVVAFRIDGTWEFDMYAASIPHMIKVLQAVYKQWEGK